MRGLHGDRQHGLAARSLRRLGRRGRVAVPRAGQPGRALQSFLAEGVWGTSPHLIPHFALHSASGTISLGLGLHGPNLGVGGGLHAAAEGFLAALTWLSIGSVPGVWLVLTGWSPELVPDRNGRPASGERDCQALALALCARGPCERPARSSGQRLARILDPRPRRSTWSRWRSTLASRAEHRPGRSRPIQLGRLRIELIEGPIGPG